MARPGGPSTRADAREALPRAGRFDSTWSLLAGHRCPGEFIPLDLLKSATKLFAAGIDQEVPPQDLSIDLGRVPTLPASGMVIARVRLTDRPGNRGS